MRIGMTWGSIFSCAYTGKQRFRLPGRHRHPASVTIGEPMPRHTSAYEMRIILSELAASTELIPDRDECPLHTAFARQAKHHPLKRTVMECSHGRWQRPGNLKLLIRMVVLSRCFRRLCANDGEYVGIMLPNTLAYAVTFIAIHMANKTPAVLNFTASREALAGAVQQARLRHIITSRVFLTRQRIPETPEMVFFEDIMAGGGGFRKHLGWFLACLLLPADELMRQVSPENWNDVRRNGVLIFSSGSTGRPKGIMLSHHNIIADVHSISTTLCWQRNDSVLGNLPLFHSFGMTVCLWLPLITGTKTVLIPNPLDAALTGLALRTEKISLLCATPGFLQLYMRRCVPEDFKSLRIVITGAEKLRDDIAENFRRMTGIVITEGYGCTELSPVVTINLAPTASELGSRVIERGSIGPSLIGVCAKVVDPSTFELMPENTDGLLIVTGAIVMRGYLNDPEKTKEVIRDGWYITGDIARMNRRGFITITGRLSRFSKIAGEMVPHELVERELNNILQPDDRLLAVCGAADPDPGRGERLLVFYTDSERLAPELVVRELRERGIPNLWIPRPENFIQVPELPVLGSGKLDLEKLKIMAAAVCAGENRG